MNTQATFTKQELAVIAEALNHFILEGFPKSENDPIVTAYEKITGEKVYEEEA